MQIVITDRAYRTLAATEGVLLSMGVKLEDGNWSVLVSQDIMEQIIKVHQAGETPSDTLMRLVLM